MGLKYKYDRAKMTDLLLDCENPRFASSGLFKNSESVSQETIIEHLMKFANIGNLAKRINEVEELHGSELITCYIKNGQYVVIEGNRRVCACKLLLNRDLIPEKYKDEFPVISEKTRENIEEITINIYPDRESVQAYLSDRHIKGVKKWSSLEKNNFYMNLFKHHNSIENVMKFTSDSEASIKNCIRKYQFFMDVFDTLRTKYPDKPIDDMDYLPLVNKFMDLLLGDDSEVGLNIKLDENDLKYYSTYEKEGVYKEILLLVGEAFLIREDRIKDDSTKLKKVVSTELTDFKNQKDLIKNDIRIPGLYKLIKKYKGIDDINMLLNGFNCDKAALNRDETTGSSTPDLNGKPGSNVNSNGISGIASTVDSLEIGGNDDNSEQPINAADSIYCPPPNNSSFDKSAKYLCFTVNEASKFVINGDSGNEKKIRSIIRDLRYFSVYKHPYTCSLLYRTLLEASARFVFDKYGNDFGRVYNDNDLTVNLVYLNDNFLFSNTKEKDAHKTKKAIKNYLGQNGIVDILNLYIHYGKAVDEALLMSSWKTMKYFIAMCLEK